jgi:hypothetical protein
MRSATFFSVIATALAARPFLDVADTGLEDYLTGTANWSEGTLPSLRDMKTIPDFEFAAKQVLEDEGWSFYRLAAGQEWSESDTYLMIFRIGKLIDGAQATETTWMCGKRYNSGPDFCKMWSTC